MKKIILLLSISVLAFAGAYKHKQSVIDTKNHLQWQDMPDNQDLDRKYREANSYCKSLDLLSYNDWRLPTVKELQSMVAISKDKKLFKFVAVDGYWSSEEDKKDEVNVMEAFSTNGHVFAADRCDTSHFRCVRDYR